MIKFVTLPLQSHYFLKLATKIQNFFYKPSGFP